MFYYPDDVTLIYIFSLMPFIELKRVREAKKEEKKRLADEDAQRRIKLLEEQCSALQKQVANHKQEEEALLSEMEVTGQAFEDMQDQNSKLLQQLSEKDDANFKLMSERIKSNQVCIVTARIIILNRRFFVRRFPLNIFLLF